MKVLLTGGTGFLGGRVLSALLAKGDHVRCLVRPQSDASDLEKQRSTNGSVEIVRGDLLNAAFCEQALAGCEAVYHLAAEMRGATAVLFLANVVGTRVLVNAARRCGIQRFVQVSSLAVYDSGGLPKNATLDERCRLEPKPYLRDAYTYSKIEQERVVWEAHKKDGLPLTVIRPGVIYGPGRDCLSGRVGLRLGNTMLVMGGKQPLPYTHVENCAEAIALAGRADEVDGMAFNVVDDELPTGLDLVRQYRTEVGKIRRIRVPMWGVQLLSRLCNWYHHKSHGQLPAVLTPYKSRAMWNSLSYSNALAKQQLGWLPRTPLKEGLRETLSSLRKSK
jgi:nucleoside-diphosphate-sugar epimerase